MSVFISINPTNSVINSKDGKWSWALDDLTFDTVCQFRTYAVAKPEERLNGHDESPAIFIPSGIYNYEQAVVNGILTLVLLFFQIFSKITFRIVSQTWYNNVNGQLNVK